MNFYSQNRVLNVNAGYIGYASQLFDLLHSKEIANADSDQLYFTQLFLNEETRSKFKIKLDTNSLIFQNLNGATGELEM